MVDNATVDRRLPHLSACRHVRHRQARRRHPGARDPRRGEPGDRLGQRADAAACDGAGLGRPPEPRAAGALRGDGGERAGRWPPACLPDFPMPTCERRPQRGRRDRRQPRSSPSSCATSCSTSPGSSARPLSTRPSRSPPPSAAPRRCRRDRPDGPMVLLDHYDNCASGGTMDTTEVLAEIFRQGSTTSPFFGICDPGARCSRRSPPASAPRVDPAVGGKLAMPALPARSKPLDGHGRGATSPPATSSATGGLGPASPSTWARRWCWTPAKVEIVLVTRQVEPARPDCSAPRHRPDEKRYVAIKSRVHWRAGLGAMARGSRRVRRHRRLHLRLQPTHLHKVRRPIYPLDPGTNGPLG